MLAKAKNFFSEVRMELDKVTWPERKETIATTWVVIVVVTIIAFYLGLCDVILTKVLRSILR